MILKANSFYIPLKDKTVQAVITSPPYWGLREYDIDQVEINGWTGHHGLEPTLDQYIENSMIWIDEVMRVLRDDGVFFLNIGDSYAGNGGAFSPQTANCINHYKNTRRAATPSGIKRKCKLLIPYRIAIAMIDRGWVCRNDIIWNKKNSLPESVKDRFGSKFEYIFMFVKHKKYYFNLDAVREKIKIPKFTGKTKKSISKWNNVPGQHTNGFMRNGGHCGYYDKDGRLLVNPNGKNPGNVWDINNQPNILSHYATFPERLVERMLLCSTRPGDFVMDPFAGSGTTGRVAIKYGRKPILLDLGYQDLQRGRTRNVQKVLSIDNNQMELRVK